MIKVEREREREGWLYCIPVPHLLPWKRGQIHDFHQLGKFRFAEWLHSIFVPVCPWRSKSSRLLLSFVPSTRTWPDCSWIQLWIRFRWTWTSSLFFMFFFQSSFMDGRKYEKPGRQKHAYYSRAPRLNISIILHGTVSINYRFLSFRVLR